MPEPPERLAVMAGALVLAALEETQEYDAAEFADDHGDEVKEQGE